MGPFVMPPPAGAGLQSGLRPSLRPAPAGNHTGHHSCRSTGQDNCRRRIVSDDAGQFNVGTHALCWVHAERLVHKLDTFTSAARKAKEKTRALIWWLYADLKAYRAAPDPRRKAELKARFERIFTQQTCFATLNRLLARLHANKVELLRVLERPEIPLHTNGSENDIRCQVIRRKVSGTTRSDPGRDCRDTFLGLAKTCRKLGVSFWDFLGTRLGAAVATPVPCLSGLVATRCAH